VRALMILVCIGSHGFGVSAMAQDEPVFSGPQLGEAVTPFEMTAVVGAEVGSSVDLVTQAGQGPQLLIFVHEKTRPAFGLMNALCRFCEQTQKDRKLTHGVTFLSADPTETETWLKRVVRNLPQQTPIGYSPEGQEGPGAWGLNRNVAMTVIVANEGKVVANFALVQPSIAQDGPKILKAVVEATGGGDVPDISKFSNRMRSQPQRPMQNDGPDESLRAILRPVLNKEATEDQVTKAAAAVEAYARENPAARKQIGIITNRIIDAGRLEAYGTPKAQEFLKQWAEKWGEKNP
jgi:hypothetical protein